MVSTRQGGSSEDVGQNARPKRRRRLGVAVCAIATLLAAVAVAVARIGLASTKDQTQVFARDPVASEISSDSNFVWGTAGPDVVVGPTYELTIAHDTRAIEGDDLRITVTIASISPEVARAIEELALDDSPTTRLALSVECEAFTVTPKSIVPLPLRGGAATVFGLTPRSIGKKLVFVKAEVQLGGIDILPTEDGRETFTLSIDVRARPVFLGLTEAQLRALQMGAGVVGIPSVIAAIVTWLLGRKKAAAPKGKRA